MACRKIFFLLILSWSAALFFSPASAEAALEKKVLKLVSKAVFEVVVRKPPEDAITYERPLPLDLLPYAERMDKYLSIGTAFAISPTELVSAAHVLALNEESQYKDYFVRDVEGKVYPIDNILSYSERRDFVTFSVSGRRFDVFLPVNAEPEMNDKVYAVGNALGEGVVIRDGLYTSNTPEELNGEWKWLRFSAAASPGNSGGPLLDEAGAVIGVILRKSPNENLNMALPIREVTGDRSGMAHVYQKSFFQLDNMQMTQVDTLEWKTALPKPYRTLNNEITAVVDNFTSKLFTRYLTENRERIFPTGKASQGLLNKHYHENFPRIITMGPDGNWDAQAPNQTGDVKLGNNGYITLGLLHNSVLMQVHKPDDTPLATFHADSKLFMDTFIRSVGATRNIGIDKIKITSVGKADSEAEHTDKYGRKWQVRTWSTGYDNSRMVSVSLPVPGGCVALLRGVPTGDTYANILEMKALTDFIYVSYCGTLKMWREFLTLKQLLPPVFATMKIDFEYGRQFSYKSDRLAFSLDETDLKITENSDLHLSFGYFTEGERTVWDVKELSVGEDRNTVTNFKLTRYSRPPEALNDSEKSEWEKIAARKVPFNRTSYFEENSTKIATVQTRSGVNGNTQQEAVLYRLGYRKEGSHGQQEMESALDAFVKKVTLYDGVRKSDTLH